MIVLFFKALKYWKLITIAFAVISTIAVGGYWYVSSLQKRIAAQDIEIRDKDRKNLEQAGEIVGLKVDAYQDNARRDVINRQTDAKVREWQIKIKTTNNQRGGGLENALLEKGDLTIDIINRTTADSLRQLESATDSSND